jgi:hypothetical protein
MISLLDSPGFDSPWSCFKPAREIEYLGLIINSTTMKVCLTPRKKAKIIELRDCLSKEMSYSKYGKITRVYEIKFHSS